MDKLLLFLNFAVKEILPVIIWPFTIFICIFMFRKIFTYFFLSIKTYNIFGIKGELKDVEKVIEDRAQIISNENTKKKEEALITENKEREIEKLKQQLSSQNNSIERLGNITDKAINLAQEALLDYKRVVDEKNELRSTLSSGRSLDVTLN